MQGLLHDVHAQHQLNQTYEMSLMNLKWKMNQPQVHAHPPSDRANTQSSGDAGSNPHQSQHVITSPRIKSECTEDLNWMWKI